METIAVYWEERVKVYSINEKTGLALSTLQLTAQQMPHLAKEICLLEKTIGRFELVTSQNYMHNLTDTIYLYIVLAAEKTDRLGSWAKKLISDNRDIQYSVRKPVEMLYLHGPHFQDRYGIADIAFSAFAENNCELLLCGCAGTSMYLVLPKEKAQTGKTILSSTFLAPTSS